MVEKIEYSTFYIRIYKGKIRSDMHKAVNMFVTVKWTVIMGLFLWTSSCRGFFEGFLSFTKYNKMVALRYLRKTFYWKCGAAVKLCQSLSSKEHDVPRVRRSFTLFSPLYVPFLTLSNVKILQVRTKIITNGDFSLIVITYL